MRVLFEMPTLRRFRFGLILATASLLIACGGGTDAGTASESTSTNPIGNTNPTAPGTPGTPVTPTDPAAPVTPPVTPTDPVTAAPVTPAATTTGTLAVASNPLTLQPVTDPSRSTTLTIPVAGGTIKATAADGAAYSLFIPADALLQATTITMTPLARIDALDLATDGAYGVQLSPEGARFQNFVTLTITPPAGVSAPLEKQLPIGWSGAKNVVSVATIDKNSRDVKLKLLHFSGYALLLATKGINATLEPARHRFGGDAEARIQSVAAERLLRERQTQLLAGESPPIDTTLGDLIKQYEDEVIKPRVAAARSSCAAGRLAQQTVLGHSRQKQLLGYPDDGGAETALIGKVMQDASAACTEEEYSLCRDNHIITRIFPYYLGVARQAALLGTTPTGTASDPIWVRDALAAVEKCLNFELQVNSRLDYAYTGGVDTHTVVEVVESRLKLPFNLGTAIFGNGELYVAGSRGADALISRSYDVNYPHQCAQVSNVQRIGAGMQGVLGFTPQEGSLVDRAKVKDFYLTPAVSPNGFGSGYTLATRGESSSGGCEGSPAITQEHDNWFTRAFPTWSESFADPELGMAIRGWTIVAGDIMATKDFTTQESSSNDNAVGKTSMILFHKPAP